MTGRAAHHVRLRSSVRKASGAREGVSAPVRASLAIVVRTAPSSARRTPPRRPWVDVARDHAPLHAARWASSMAPASRMATSTAGTVGDGLRWGCAPAGAAGRPSARRMQRAARTARTGVRSTLRCYGDPPDHAASSLAARAAGRPAPPSPTVNALRTWVCSSSRLGAEALRAGGGPRAAPRGLRRRAGRPLRAVPGRPEDPAIGAALRRARRSWSGRRLRRSADRRPGRGWLACGHVSLARQLLTAQGWPYLLV